MAASLSFDDACDQVKRGRLAPVFYLTGAEAVLRDELIDLVVEHALDPAGRDFNVDRRNAADLDGESLHALIETPPLLAERRVVVVRGLEQWRANAKVWQVLERYLERPSETTVLLLADRAEKKPRAAIAQRAVHVALEPLSGEETARWARARAEHAGLSLQPDALRCLVSTVGNDLDQLALEIAKLAAAAAGDAPLSEEAIRPYLGVPRGESIFDWVAAVLRRDVALATGMVGPVLAAPKASGVQMVTLLGVALLGTMVARRALDAGGPSRVRNAIFQQLKATKPVALRGWAWGDAAQLWSEAAPRWSVQELAHGLRAALAADRALKATTVSGEEGILTQLVLELGAKRAAA